MLQSFVSLEESHGRTIKRTSLLDGKALLLFTDGSILILKVERDRYYQDSFLLFQGAAEDFDVWDARNLGTISEEELDRQRQEEQKRADEASKQHRLQQWRALNREFKGTPEENPCECALCQVGGNGACKIFTMKRAK